MNEIERNSSAQNSPDGDVNKIRMFLMEGKDEIRRTEVFRVFRSYKNAGD